VVFEPTFSACSISNPGERSKDLSFLIARLRRRLSSIVILVIASFLPCCASADTAAFDLAGPKVEVRVKRDDKTLPIS
jgi:hypothetical protein